MFLYKEVFILLLFIFSVLHVAATRTRNYYQHKHTNNEIIFAIDKRPGLNPSLDLHITKSLFTIKFIHQSTDITSTLDMISHANWTNLITMYKQTNSNNTALLPNQKSIIEMFENKITWKDWMVHIGLDYIIPRAYNINNISVSNLPYPVILKTNQHFGRGVFIINNGRELNKKVLQLNAKKESFMLEESLTGLGQSEVSAFGGAYRGRLLSMRCVIRSFATASAASTAGNSTSGGAGDRPYVRGFHLKHSHEHWLPCGRDLIAVHKKMFAATTYSGSWCSEVKLDSKMQPKILEVNARFCGSLAGNDALFVLSFVPIAFAMLEADPSARIAHALRGAHNGTYRHILAQEQNALETGGGFYLRQWVTVDKFNPFLKLDPVDQYLTRQTIRAYSKIVVAVKDPDLLFRLNQLKASSSLFEFYSATKVPRSVDLILPASISTNNHVRWKETLTSLGYAVYLNDQIRAGFEHSKNGTVKVFGAAHYGSLLSMRCVLYTLQKDDYTLGTSIPKKQLVACGRDLVSVLTGYFAESGSFAGAFCATVEMDASGQLKFTELQMGLCEELTLSDAGFIGAYVPLAAALFIDRNRDRGGSRSSTPIELNWLENRKIFRHIIAVERHVLAGGGSMHHNHLLTASFFNPLRPLNHTGYMLNKDFSLPCFY